MKTDYEQQIEALREKNNQLEQELTKLRGDQCDKITFYKAISDNRALKEKNNSIKSLSVGMGVSAGMVTLTQNPFL